MNLIPNHDRELRRAREAAEGEIRRLIGRYEATGRDYHAPERVALEHALARRGEGVAHGEHVWSYSPAEGSLVRARTRAWRFSKEPSLPAGTKVYRHAYHEDLSERAGLEIEHTSGGGRV